MNCEKAMEAIREGLGFMLERRTPKLLDDIHLWAAFDHVGQCGEERCSRIRRELNSIIRSIEHETELLTDEDGKLPFNY